MAIVSAGYAGTVNDSQWALMSRFFGQDFGILNLGELNCTNPAGTKNFNLSAGTLYGRGVMDVSDAVVNVAPTVPVSGGQWFLIVARRVWATKTTSFIALPGPTTTTATPTARPAAYPAMQRNPGVQDDQPLWWVWVNASNTTTVRFDQRIFSNGRVADFGAIPPTGFLTRGSQLTVESVRMTIVDDGTAWKPITMRVSGTTAQRNEATAAGMVAEGMEWRDTTDNSAYVRSGGAWVELPRVVSFVTSVSPSGGGSSSGIYYSNALVLNFPNPRPGLVPRVAVTYFPQAGAVAWWSAVDLPGAVTDSTVSGRCTRIGAAPVGGNVHVVLSYD